MFISFVTFLILCHIVLFFPLLNNCALAGGSLDDTFDDTTFNEPYSIPYAVNIIEFAPNVLQKDPTYKNAIRNQLHNVNKIYREITNSRSTNDTEIVLLPEYGLNGPVMRTREEVKMFSQEMTVDMWKDSPENCSKWTFNADNDRSVLADTEQDERYVILMNKLQCMAQRTGKYVAVNLAEQLTSDESSSIQDSDILDNDHFKSTPGQDNDMNGLNTKDKHDVFHQESSIHNKKEELFNTMVVLDTKGKILAQYRKRHLYGNEINIFDPGHDDQPVFVTDSGVQFGLMICFDLMFEPNAALKEENIQAWLVSSWWVNFPPQINALQMQMGYSLVYEVQLFVANSGYSWHSSGSGGYDSGTTLSAWYNPTKTATTRSLFASTNFSRDAHLASSLYRVSSSSVGVQFDPKATPVKSSTTRTVNKPSRDVTYKIINVPAKSGTFSFEDDVTVGTVSCEIAFDVSVNTDHADQKSYTYALYAISGQIWPAREGDICGIIYCGGSPDNATTSCEDTLSLYNLHQDVAPVQFHAIDLRSLYSKKVYDSFPLISRGNMSLPSSDDYFFVSLSQSVEYQLAWKKREKPLQSDLNAFQVLGLRPVNGA